MASSTELATQISINNCNIDENQHSPKSIRVEKANVEVKVDSEQQNNELNLPRSKPALTAPAISSPQPLPRHAKSRVAELNPSIQVNVASTSDSQDNIRSRNRGISFYASGPPRPKFIPQVAKQNNTTVTTATQNQNSSTQSQNQCNIRFENNASKFKPSKRFKLGIAETIGRRKEMEDVSILIGCFRDKDNEDLIAIFDGHGGRQVAEYVGEHLPDILKKQLEDFPNDVVTALKNTFLQINQQIIQQRLPSGSTGCVVLIIDDIIYTANIGDTRAVLCRQGHGLRLTIDHKPDLPEEKQNIETNGGFVQNSRLNGVLAVSRAFGDITLHPVLSCEPYISTTTIDKNIDKYLIVACDGFWDIFNDDLGVQIVKSETDPIKACEKLRDRAYYSGSRDNISVAIVIF
eukprot:TRINITY_DN1803_c2_g1_i1.p1 TRINITY_DN1803_c2_g1~~TRINITY_DN1803_c2_g1_i1.p1  ORF type:complete len:405 (-),score=208.78 TRINITY_DN1803_c2_g1_i1:41-1255(-)